MILGPEPSAGVDGLDLLSAVRDRLSDEECQIADRWASGEAWDRIGERVGARPDTLRIRLARALDRVRKDFRLAD